ncbi:MAG: hypothetical protein JNJ61_17665 [Anaerolineae bacterium]|nr:hypothetical protein [Anaerolineae bacterium]
MNNQKYPPWIVMLALLTCVSLAVSLTTTSAVYGQEATATPEPPEPIVLTPIAAAGYSGMWAANPGQEVTISLYMVNDDEYELAALIHASGVIAWDEQGRLTSGDDVRFTEIQTVADPDHWYRIVDTEIQDDGLVSITTEEGLFSFLPPATSNEPTSRPLTEVTINEDGNWEGQASFFLTGFGAGSFAAFVYMDVRSYNIPSLGITWEASPEVTEIPDVTPEATEMPDASSSSSPLTRAQSQELFDSWGSLQLMRTDGMVAWEANGEVRLAGNIEIDMGFETPPQLTLMSEAGEDHLIFDTLLPSSDTVARVIFESTEVNGAQFHIPSFTVTSVGFENETSYFTVDGFADYSGDDHTFEFGVGKFPRGVFITDMNIFTDGAEHYIYGEIELFGATIRNTSTGEPIVFKISDGEYIHLEGEGTMTTNQGDVVTFGD